MSFDTNFLAASRRSRASLSDTSGYTPRERRFSLQLKRYLKRHHLPPPGEISRYRPFPSNRRVVFGHGLAFLIWVSVRTFGATPSAVYRLPPELPSDVRLYRGTVKLKWIKRQEKASSYAGSWTVLDVAGLMNGGGGGNIRPAASPLRGRRCCAAAFFGVFRCLVEPAPRIHDPCALKAINKNATRWVAFLFIWWRRRESNPRP